MNVKLYVGNMPFETTEETIQAMFEKAGTVVSVTLIRDRSTGASKGFGFVEMGSQNDAQEAIKALNGYTMGDRQLTVNVARPREERGGFQKRNNSHKRDNRGGGRRY